MDNQFNFESYNKISDSLESEIRELEQISNAYDKTQYQLFLENAYNADRTINFVYLYRYKGQLVSLLIIFFPTVKDIEVYGFTHPDFRCRGLFSSLVKFTEKPLKPLGDYSHLFVCDPASSSGMGFLSKMYVKWEETEYMMELNWTLFHSYLNQRDRDSNSIVMSEAKMEHINQIAQIASNMYDEERSPSSDFVKQTILSDKRTQLIGLLNDQIIGICTIGQEEDCIMINGLAIDKSYQGNGYGRDLLDQVLTYVENEYTIPLKLEVSSVNDKAFNLYKSVGFEQKESYGYYRKKR